DAHLWAETYDRKLTDIFAVETEIAKNIAEALQAKLTGSEKSSMAKVPTANPEAYELYLKGRFFWNKRTGTDLHKAIQYFQQAIELKPNYATAHHWLALGFMTLAQFDPGISEAKRAIELDPLSLIINADCGWVYFNARRYDDAEAQARRTLEMDSRFFLAHYYLGAVLQFKGQIAQAIPEYQTAFDLNHDLYSLAMLGQAYARNRQKEEARKILARLSEEAKSHYVAPYAFALVQIPLGEKDRAIEELAQAS